MIDIRALPSRIAFEIRNALFLVVEPEPPVTDPGLQLNTNTLARLRACQRKMRKAGILAIAGYTPPPRGESVQQLWARHGWAPPHNGLQVEPAKVEPEIIETAEVRKLGRRAAK